MIVKFLRESISVKCKLAGYNYRVKAPPLNCKFNKDFIFPQINFESSVPIWKLRLQKSFQKNSLVLILFPSPVISQKLFWGQKKWFIVI